MKQRFWFIMGGIALLIIIVIAVAASSGGSATKPTPTKAPTATPVPTPKTFTFTVAGDIGVDRIEVTNMNTPASMTLTTGDLPATFSFSENQVLVFNVTAKDGYLFDHWVVDDGTWQSKNPLTLKPSGSFSMIAKCITKE